MANDNFILVRVPKAYKQTERAVIRVSISNYTKLTQWAAETGMPLSAIADQAIAFAEKHLKFVED